jgi:beta-phosphoglucomutase
MLKVPKIPKYTDLSIFGPPGREAMKAVIFDMDGVLVDSEAFICSAGVEMFREKGFNVDRSDFLEFTGMGENRYLGGVAEKHHIPFEVKKDKARTYEIYSELVSGHLTPLPGAVAFVRQCLDRDLQVALATSADPVKVQINLREIGIPHNAFHALVTGLDIRKTKPAPDIFLKAASLLGVDPGDCLVVEDAVSGVQAGKSAGARVLAVTTSFGPEALSGADWIVDSLEDVPPEVLEW